MATLPIFDPPTIGGTVPDCCDTLSNTVHEALIFFLLPAFTSLFAICCIGCEWSRWRRGCREFPEDCDPVCPSPPGSPPPRRPKTRFIALYLPHYAPPRMLFQALFFLAPFLISLITWKIWRDDGEWCEQYIYMPLWYANCFVYPLWPILLLKFKRPGISLIVLILYVLWVIAMFAVYILYTNQDPLGWPMFIIYIAWLACNIGWMWKFYRGYGRKYGFASKKEAARELICCLKTIDYGILDYICPPPADNSCVCGGNNSSPPHTDLIKQRQQQQGSYELPSSQSSREFVEPSNFANNQVTPGQVQTNQSFNPEFVSEMPSEIPSVDVLSNNIPQQRTFSAPTTTTTGGGIVPI